MKTRAHLASIAVAASLTVVGGCGSIIQALNGPPPAPRKTFPPAIVSAEIEPAVAPFAARWSEAYPYYQLRRVENRQAGWKLQRNEYSGTVTARTALMLVAYAMPSGECYIEDRLLIEESVGDDRWTPPEVGIGPGDTPNLGSAQIDCQAVPPATAAATTRTASNAH
jgi:hypothetical protein